jgi:glucose-1-phosphate thymidylyltransferase
MTKKRKGIILAGGFGSRLWPVSITTSKHLLPVFDKPLIYYPLTTLMLAGITDILIISNAKDLGLFKALLKDGSNLGLNIEYKIQEYPNGIAEAFIIGENFIGNNNCALILGDNIFYGSGLSEKLLIISNNNNKATAFAFNVKKTEEYGICKFNEHHKVIDIIEKPKKFVSNWALTGLYFYDSTVVDIAKSIKPSFRNEIEITSINLIYLRERSLQIEMLDRGYAWLDAGTPESLLEASHFVHLIEKRQGLKIGCPEEISWRMGFINKKELEKLINDVKNDEYREYLIKIIS